MPRSGSVSSALLRTLHGYLDTTVIATLLRENVIPAILSVIGFLFTQDVRDTFARAGTLLARR